MRSVAWRFLASLAAVLALPFFVSSAHAQIRFVRCAGNADCALVAGQPSCAVPRTLVEGACVPEGCADATFADCFDAVGAGPEVRFLAGDCDGDLIDNGAEHTALEVCVGAEVVVRRTALGRRSGRLDATVATGVPVAPGVYTPVGMGDGPFAVACTTRDDCPALEPLHARCVGLQPGIGACTYDELFMPDDPSCLDTGITGTEGAACVHGLIGEGYDAWAAADCDRDGIANRDDWRVCGASRVARRATGGAVDCVEASLADPSTACGTPSPAVTPDGRFVCDDPAAASAFAACCREVGECPPVAGLEPVCVRFNADDASPAGACTYRAAPGAGPSVDDSCARLLATITGRVLPDTCFDGARLTYDSWAAGGCDLDCGDDIRNDQDDLVCACEPIAVPDAGLDAMAALDAAAPPVDDAGPGLDDGGATRLDAAGPGLDDGGAAGLDAAGADEDVGVEGNDAGAVSFAGSGCRCRAHATRASAHSTFALASLVLLSLVARRTTRSRRF